jgi:hypothetical protein
MIAAMQVVKDQNKTTSASVADKVSVVTYDGIGTYQTPTVRQALTNDYQAAMLACTKLQACADIGASTATENGVIAARAHLKPTAQGGQGRLFTKKVMILITDGMPNLWQSSSGTINGYVASNPDSNYYGTGYDWFNSVLMQAAQFQAEKGSLYPIGMGLGADYDFMDRIGRISTTDDNGQSPRSSGNPAEYEQQLTEIFKKIIKNPGVRLVK